MPFSIRCSKGDLMLSDICINTLPCTRSAVMRIVLLSDLHTHTTYEWEAQELAQIHI